jgi:RNA polymerase sigma-70 factor (ECF subfamily)
MANALIADSRVCPSPDAPPDAACLVPNAHPECMRQEPGVTPAERRAHLVAFHDFYLAHVELVRRVVVRLLGPEGQVDDAIQEAFLIAWRKRGSFRGNAQASTWLYSIAYRVALSMRRRARVLSWFGLDAVPEPSDPTTPHTYFERRESAEQLYALLDRISDKKRSVWILCELEGLSGEDVASIVGCPLKTVWTRLYHARRELHELARAHSDTGRGA